MHLPWRKQILTVAWLTLCGIAMAANRPEVALRDELWHAEEAFAAMAMDKGVKEAFLANLSDSSTIFRPGPVNGRLFMAAEEPDSSRLRWEPLLCEVAYDGKLGYTIGPWSYSPNDTTPPVAFGHFFSIWRKEAAGWKVLFDAGIGHAKPDSGMLTLTELRSDRIAANKVPDRDESRRNRSLEIADNVYATLNKKEGSAIAFGKVAASDVRLLRNRALPQNGIDAARAYLALQNRTVDWKIRSAVVATSGDLGYTWGDATAAAADKLPELHGYYVRIWRMDREENWKLVVDAMFYVPPKSTGN